MTVFLYFYNLVGLSGVAFLKLIIYICITNI